MASSTKLEVPAASYITNGNVARGGPSHGIDNFAQQIWWSSYQAVLIGSSHQHLLRKGGHWLSLLHCGPTVPYTYKTPLSPVIFFITVLYILRFICSVNHLYHFLCIARDWWVIIMIYLFTSLLTYFNALTLLVGRQEGHLAYKNWVVGCWHGYLSGARCRLAHGPADGTATHCLLLQ